MGEPALQPSAIIAIDGLTVRYGGAVALSHLTVSFPPGATGLLGVNGAGKTTLIHAILGLVTPESGRVHVFGLDAADEPLAVLDKPPATDRVDVMRAWRRMRERCARIGRATGPFEAR